jgi:hypothetical protein
MTFWKEFSSTPSDPVMKSIMYRGGVVTFRIPSQWREEYSDADGGTFYDDRPESGTLRLKVITMVAPRKLHANSAMELLQVAMEQLKNADVKGTTKIRKDGNAVLKYEQESSEHGTFLTIVYWVIANPLPPRQARIATFSYAILVGRRNAPQVQRDLDMLETEIEAATFASKTGVVPE